MEFTEDEVEILRAWMDEALHERGQDALFDDLTVAVARRLATDENRANIEELIRLRAAGV